MSSCETRKENVFKWQKKFAEVKGEPFPYKNYEEWKADAPKREEERKRYWSQKHVWLEDFFYSNRAYYNFINPETGKEVGVEIYHGASDTCMEIGLINNDKGNDLD